MIGDAAAGFGAILHGLRADRPRPHLAALARGLAEPALRQIFCTRVMLWAARQSLPDVGNGLYVATKR